ncbi:ultraviolet-B receptor UVR8-like [Bidens hawaiensis]|uniref:ultraviolet-B receptor UVR8-like n=1 Tax=Bidens hawaiensis TaxID=980011 RepID=UPI004049A0FB
MKGGGVEGKAMKMKTVYMLGYLPGALPQRSPIMSPVEVRRPQSADAGEFWLDVCGGGCGFAMAISDTGKLITWGSTDDLGQSYVTSGKHGETPEPFPLPNDVSLVKAAAGWAHCVCVTVAGEVYTWGWKECVPSDNPFFTEQMSPAHSEVSRSTDVVVAHETTKRRRLTSTSQAGESSSSGDEDLSALPCLVAFMYPGVKISTVAAGGRHTLALSDIGQVWGWGYGGEGQLGLGSRIRMVSSPRYIPCIATSTPGTYVTRIACGGRHSAVITDAGALVTFGWGLYGQCGQGTTDDELSPTYVSSLLGIRIDGVAAGLWHTICISGDGNVYAFGGNQFGQLGTGTDQAETLPRLLDAPSLENEHARVVSCGARHSAIVTDGKVFSWGWNKYGQLGLGDLIDRNIPSQVELDGYVPKAVACGWWHTLVLAESLT